MFFFNVVIKEQPKVKMVMQVHDELVFEISEDILAISEAKIDYLMSHAMKLDVPLIVEIGRGNNWDEAH